MTDGHLRIQKLLFDIHKSSTRIVTRSEGRTEEDFSSPGGEDLRDIVARHLGIVGEASAALLRKHPDFCEAHREIPLRQARGLRNLLVHEYDGVDWHEIWIIAQNDIPKLLKAVTPLLDEDAFDEG